MQLRFADLRARLLFLILLAFIPVFGLMLHTARLEHQQETERAREQTQSLVQSVILEQKRFMDDTQLLLRTLAYLPEVRNLDVGFDSLTESALKPFHKTVDDQQEGEHR